MALLAAELDDRIVMLDTEHAQVILLDPYTERVWRACRGLSEKDLAAALGEAPSDLTRTIGELAGAGLISSADGRWSQMPVTWI